MPTRSFETILGGVLLLTGLSWLPARPGRKLLRARRTPLTRDDSYRVQQDAEAVLLELATHFGLMLRRTAASDS